MNLADLSALYLLGGVVCAASVWRRSDKPRPSAATLLMALIAWPLWAPFALADPRPRRRPPRKRATRGPAAPSTVSTTTLLRALDKAVAVACDTPFEAMLNEDAAERIATEVRAACERLNELNAVLDQPDLNLQKAKRSVRDLQADDASLGTQGAARAHLSNVQRLDKLRRAQALALRELDQALGALHSQLIVAHYAGSTSDGVDAIVSDLWARVEGLGEALEPESILPLRDDEQARLETS